MTTTTLQLEEYFLTRLQVEFTEPAEGRNDNVEATTFRFDYNVLTHREDQRRRMMRLRAEFQEVDGKKQNLGYGIQCELSGLFAFTDATPKGKEELVIRINGFNMLYGALRGILSTATAMFPGGRFLVPNVMPNEIVADIEKRHEAARAKERAKPGEAVAARKR